MFSEDNFEENESYDTRDEVVESAMSSFSGVNGTFNPNIANGKNRGLFNGGRNKKKRATIQISVKNLVNRQQVYEIFNSNNSIAIQPDDALYADFPISGGGWKPLDAAGTLAFAQAAAFDAGLLTVPNNIVAFDRKGNLAYVDSSDSNGTPLTTQLAQLYFNAPASAPTVPTLIVSLRSTLGGNTYRRLIEKMKTSVLHVTNWKIQCSNDQQFENPIAQKDYTITGASQDDEFQVSSAVSSRDFNTKIVEINDKMLLIDGDSRISGIIEPLTEMTFTFEIDIINEITKSVFR